MGVLYKVHVLGNTTEALLRLVDSVSPNNLGRATVVDHGINSLILH